MSIRVPQGCKTPKSDRDGYALTTADIRFMTAQIEKINDMLSYYVNMPENATGELVIAFRSDKGYDAFTQLIHKTEDVVNTLNDVTWRCS